MIPASETPFQLGEIRRQFTELLLRIYLVGACLLLVASLSRIPEFGWLTTMTRDVLAFVTVAAVFILRTRLPAWVPPTLIIGIPLILGTTSLIAYGLLGTADQMLLVAAILALLLITRRTLLLALLALNALVVIIAAHGHVQGWLTSIVEPSAYAVSAGAWTVILASMVVFVVMFALVHRQLVSHLVSLGAETTAQRNQLARHAAELELRVEQRTAELQQALDNSREAEQRLAQSQRHLRTIVEQMPVGIYDEDWSALKPEVDALLADGVTDIEQYLHDHPEQLMALSRRIRIRAINQRALEMIEMPAAMRERSIEAINDFYDHELDEPFFSTAMTLAALAGRQTRTDATGPLITMQGNARTVRTQSFTLDDDKSDWSQVLTVVTDITDLEQSRLTNERLLTDMRQLITELPVGFWEEDWSGVKARCEELKVQGVENLADYFRSHPVETRELERSIRIRAVNDYTLGLFKVESVAELQRHLGGVEGSLTSFVDSIEHLWYGTTSHASPDVQTTATGETIHTLSRMFLPSGHQDDWSRVVAITVDLTKEYRLQQEQAMLANGIEQIAEMVVVFDAEDRIVFCNAAWRHLNRGAPGSTLPGTRFIDHLHMIVEHGLVPEAVGREAAWIEKRMEQHIQAETTHELQRQDGIVLHLRESKLADGGRILLLRDITELKRAEAIAIHASKLATLGEMSTGVAHELNQPLHIIRLAVGNARRAMTRPDIDLQHLATKLETIDRQVVRAAAIIDHMRMFGRESKEVYTPIQPEELIESALGMLKEQLRLQSIDVEFEGNTSACRILGHPILFEQVLLNLLGNARDAIVAANSDQRRIRITCLRDNRQIRIHIDDSGPGIEQAAMGRLFEPFFTTKEIGKGTGLGLSVSYGIIQDFGGTLVAENRAKGGARFTISLPLLEEPGTPGAV